MQSEIKGNLAFFNLEQHSRLGPLLYILPGK
jgi:hypothetical protein